MNREKKLADLEFYLMQGLSLLNELKKEQETDGIVKKKKSKLPDQVAQDFLARRHKMRLKSPA